MSFPRYQYDDPPTYALELHELPEELRARTAALGNSVRVSSRLLGDIHDAVCRAAERLDVVESVECFVTANPQFSAECYRDADGGVVVMLSSHLVNLLSLDELTFVIGHELTHAQLDHHGWIPPGQRDASDRALEGLRAMEISADRGGAIACGDIDTSIRAIAKTASGIATIVNDLNVLEYVRQERSARMSANYAGVVMRSTHPPFVTRARALLRLAAVSGSTLALDALAAADLRQLDFDIARDLDAIFLRAAGVDDRCKSAAFWIALDEAMPVADPVAWARTQVPHLGDQRAHSLAALAADLTPEELQSHVVEKASAWRIDMANSVAAMRRRVDELLASLS